jgi:type IV pilus assembly protein PilC
MAKFVYEGEASDGSKVRETVTADDRYAVYDVARNNGHTVSSVTEAKGFSLGVGGFDMEKINAWLGKVKQDELVMMTRNLGSMLDAGLTVTRALSVIERQSKNAKLKATVKDIIERINKGGQFFESLSAHPKVFDDLYIAMIKAGEEAGNLAESLHTLAIQMERSTTLKKKIKGAMMYPSIVIIVMVIIGILMMIFVLPSITGIFKQMGTELPATTQILIATSDFLVANTVLALGAIIGFVTALLYALRSRPGKVVTSWLVTRIPVIGTMAKETNAARTARTLSSLLNSGVDVIQALEITEEVVQNVFYRRIIRAARDKVEKGTALSEIFIERSDLYPILVGEMILVGEETGSIAKMLGELAIFYETEVERKTKDLSTIIEPLLMVVIGTGVGFFALALIAPIYSIGDSIK